MNENITSIQRESTQKSPIPATFRRYITSLSAPCLIVTNDEFWQFAHLIPDEIMLFGITSIESASIVLIDRHGDSHGVTFATTLCLGFLAINQSQLNELERARRLMESWSDLELPIPTLIPEDGLNDSLKLLLTTKLVDRLFDYAAHSTRLARELFRLRTAHEDMLNAFATLENFVNASNVQTCQLTFEHLPDVSYSSNENSFSQVLPVSTQGLSVIQLHVAAGHGTHRTGGISVELRSVEDREVHQIWIIPFEELQSGWMTFSLSKAIVGAQRTPRLIIRPLAGLGTLPSLSLGAPQPLPAFRILPADGFGPELAERSLALRIWSGIPGVRPPNFEIRSEGRSQVEDIAVPFTFFKDVQNISQNWTPDFEPVSPVPEVRGLLCHPPPQGATWGELDSFPTGDVAFRLTTRAVVRHRLAESIECALAFSAGSEEFFRQQVRSEQDIVAERDIVFSGWRLVTHEEPVLLSIFVPAGQPPYGSVFFGSRVVGDRGNSFAWATFFDFRKTFLGNNLPELNQSMLKSSHAKTDAGLSDADETVTYGNPTFPVSSTLAELSVLRPTAAVTPFSSSEGSEFPLSWLLTAASAVDETPPHLRPHYDYDRRGIICHPPSMGITLAYLDAIPVRENSLFSARTHVGNDLSGTVDFCILVSRLPPHEVLARLEEGSEDLNWSGWISTRHGQDGFARVVTMDTSDEFVQVFLATRMHPSAATNDFAWAYFMDFRIIVGDGLVTPEKF